MLVSCRRVIDTGMRDQLQHRRAVSWNRNRHQRLQSCHWNSYENANLGHVCNSKDIGDSIQRRMYNWNGLASTAAFVAGVYSLGASFVLCEAASNSPPFISVVGDTGNFLPPTPSSLYLCTSVHASKGHRSYMEDDYYISGDKTFAAVYDGHGGASVSKYLQQNLYNRYAALLPKSKNSLHTIVETLKRAIAEVDSRVLQNKRWIHQGSTAVVLVLHQCIESGTWHLITANVGDSRAVLCRLGEAIPLTKDHKPDDATELERIENLGGNVCWFGLVDSEGQNIEETGVYRINGNLAVARAIGDSSERPYVSGECDINDIPINTASDEFVIIATDGLWDVMTNDEAVQYVKAVLAGAVGALREGKDYDFPSSRDRPMDIKLSDWKQRFISDSDMIHSAIRVRKQKMARYVAQEAIRRGTEDNVTVIVIFLQ